MQNSSRNPVESYFQNKALEVAIQAKIDENLSPVVKANEELKLENERLRKKLQEKDEKNSTIRQQLQMFACYVDLHAMIAHQGVENTGRFFSALLNRNSQRAREPFSNIHKLFYSRNFIEAKYIKRDLENALKLFSEFGQKQQAQQIQKHIDEINKVLNFEEGL